MQRKRADPERFEIDRVGEKEHRARVDMVRLDQVLDFASGLFLDPVIDVLARRGRRLAEVDRNEPAAVVFLDQLLEFGEDPLARLCPERVGREQLDGAGGLGVGLRSRFDGSDRRSSDETPGGAASGGSLKCRALAICTAVSPRAPP